MEESSGQLLSFAPVTHISLGHPYPHTGMEARPRPSISVEIPSGANGQYTAQTSQSSSHAKTSKAKKTINSEAVQFDGLPESSLSLETASEHSEEGFGMSLETPQKLNQGHLLTAPSPLTPNTPTVSSPLPSGATAVPSAKRRGPGRPKGSKAKSKSQLEDDEEFSIETTKWPPAKRRNSQIGRDDEHPAENGLTKTAKRSRGRQQLDRNLVSNRAVLVSPSMPPPKLGDAIAVLPGQGLPASQSRRLSQMEGIKSEHQDDHGVFDNTNESRYQFVRVLT
jgi:hypothetical protein